MDYMRVSGGMFLDMTIHDFDMARFQVGEVEEVYASGGVLLEPELKEFGDIDTMHGHPQIHQWSRGCHRQQPQSRLWL